MQIGRLLTNAYTYLESAEGHGGLAHLEHRGPSLRLVWLLWGFSEGYTSDIPRRAGHSRSSIYPPVSLTHASGYVHKICHQVLAFIGRMRDPASHSHFICAPRLIDCKNGGPLCSDHSFAENIGPGVYNLMVHWTRVVLNRGVSGSRVDELFLLEESRDWEGEGR